MSMTRITVTVDDGTLAELKQIAPKGAVSAFVLEAIREKLQVDPIKRMLRQLDEIYGPVDDPMIDAEAKEWVEGLVARLDGMKGEVYDD